MDAATIDSSPQPIEEGSGGGFLRWLGFGFLFLLLLVLFTIAKVPQSKVQGWIIGTLNQQMGPMGMQIAADDGRIGLGLGGLSYEMSGVRLTKIYTGKTLKFSRLEISPNILVPAIQGKLGGKFRLEEGSGTISGEVYRKGEQIETTVTLEGVNLGRMGILPFAVGVEGTGDVKGTIELVGEPTSVSTLTGKMELSLAKVVIDGQKIAGFDIPRTSIADGAVNVGIGSGKANLTTVRLGKPGGTDDFFGSVSGTVTLNKAIEMSELNLKAKFGFADRYKQEKTIGLVDSLLSGYKTPDGTFSMAFTGPAYAAAPSPSP
jgi:type II secretion system protein N